MTGVRNRIFGTIIIVIIIIIIIIIIREGILKCKLWSEKVGEKVLKIHRKRCKKGAAEITLLRYR